MLEQARVLREQAAAAANPPPPARDFAGELAALEDEYENGELDVDEYVAKRDVVRDALRADTRHLPPKRRRGGHPLCRPGNRHGKRSTAISCSKRRICSFTSRR